MSIDPVRMLELAGKCDPKGEQHPEPLTWGDRHEIAQLLLEIAAEKLEPKKPNHRPRSGGHRKFHCVLRMVLDEPKPGAREAARLEFGLTERQMKEAIGLYRTDAEAIVAGTSSREGLLRVCEWHRDKK